MNAIAWCRISFAFDVCSLSHVYDEIARTDIHACVGICSHCKRTLLLLLPLLLPLSLSSLSLLLAAVVLCVLFTYSSLFTTLDFAAALRITASVSTRFNQTKKTRTSKYEACMRGLFCNTQNYTVLFFSCSYIACFHTMHTILCVFFFFWNILCFIVECEIKWKQTTRKKKSISNLYWFVEYMVWMQWGYPRVSTNIIRRFSYNFIVLLQLYYCSLSNGTNVYMLGFVLNKKKKNNEVLQTDISSNPLSPGEIRDGRIW